jgi:diadenosine tetraphosphatase ApaH/serine/threonine PP2A family protein phosphatase
MRVLVISDVHANLEALEAVLADAGDFELIWSLGDIVGYGPDPNECIARLDGFLHVAIPGNHDWGVIGRLDIHDFNPDAQQANLWTRGQLTAASRSYLEALAETHVEGDVTLAHGSPRHPIWEYLLYSHTAEQSYAYFDTPICLVGHTHLPVIYRKLSDEEHCKALDPEPGEWYRPEGARLIVNPGSVGQPRDGDPRAAYLLLDTEGQSIQHRRVAYDIAKTREKMRAVGLPRRLIARLDFGW